MAKDIQFQINEFLEVWNLEQQEKFLRDVIPIFEMYYQIDKEGDIFERAETAQDAATVRLLRSVYLISKLAEYHAAKLATVRMQWPRLWKKMENASDQLE